MRRMTDAATTTRDEIGAGAAAKCPACGYDVRGLRASSESGAVCPECGRSFAWGDAERAASVRVYEHSPRRWRVGLAWRTVLRVMLIRGFWRGVDAGAPVRARRLLTGPLLVCASAYIASLLLVYPMVFAAHTWGAQWLPDADAAEVASIVLHQFGRQWERSGRLAYNHFAPSWAIVATGAFVLGAAGAALAMWRRWPGPSRGARFIRTCAYALHAVAAWYVLHAACWVGAYAVWTVDMFDRGYVPGRAWLDIVFFETLIGKNDVGLVLAAIAWQWVFWWFALRDGLGAKQSRLVWLVAATVGTAFAVGASPMVMAHIVF